jgi:hypothetical protein
MYNITYSILCHEHPESVVDMIKNIFYYHKDISCCIIINSNHALFAALKDIQTDHVKLSDKPFNKQIFTYDIMKGHLINFKYCKEYAIESKYFIPLASNCMFHKSLTLDYIENSLHNILSKEESQYVKRHRQFTDTPFTTTWQWPKFFRNKRIHSILEGAGIRAYYGNHHEGTVYPYPIMNQIVDFIETHRVEALIEHQAVFEETLLPTLYYHFTGQHIASLCNVFWEIPNCQPTIKHITETNYPCVKRVDRDYNNLVRVWLRKRAENYV